MKDLTGPITFSDFPGTSNVTSTGNETMNMVTTPVFLNLFLFFSENNRPADDHNDQEAKQDIDCSGKCAWMTF